MQRYRKVATISVTGTILFLLFTLWSCQAVASDNETIRQRILDQATEHAALSTSKLTIYVDDGFVLLTGTVHLYLHKMDIEKIAWKTTGVTEVENEIGVKALFPVSDTAIEERIRMILMDCECLHGGAHFIQVAGGAVSVTGVFFHPRDVQFLKKKIAEIEGVVAITIHATVLLAEETTLPE
ncbi:MAG: BON domain-containing protein [Proteobacteria bacterium]|nr:BON domain-containing protein [Pseudomonadota bacterium]